MDDLDRLRVRREDLHRRVQEELALENALVNDAFSADNPHGAYDKWKAQRSRTMDAVTLWHGACDAYLNALMRSKGGA